MGDVKKIEELLRALLAKGIKPAWGYVILT